MAWHCGEWQRQRPTIRGEYPLPPPIVLSRGNKGLTGNEEKDNGDTEGAEMDSRREDCAGQGVLEISRFSCMLFLSVRGFSDYAGPTVHSRLAWRPCCLPPTRNEVGILIYGLFAAQSPRPPMPLSTLPETPRDVASKTRGQDGFATSFPVGLLHPLQHAGLSRRSPDCPSERSRPCGRRYA